MGLLWTRDRSVTETSDNSRLLQQKYNNVHNGIRTLKTSKRAAAYPRLGRRGHGDLQSSRCLGDKKNPLRLRRSKLDFSV